MSRMKCSDEIDTELIEPSAILLNAAPIVYTQSRL